MATIPTQALRHLQMETNLGTDVFIPMQVQYSEALGQPFQAQVTLACHATDVNFDDILGTNATIAIHNAATARKGAFGYTRYINGFFSSIAFHGHGAEGEALFQATVVPWLWFLTRTSDCRIFQNKTVPEILEEIFRDAGFSDFRKDLHGEYKPREFCVQFRETDFQFVMRLMECEGIYYYFEHENGSHVMVLCDDMVCHKKDDQHEVIRFIGGAEAMDRKGCINEWSFSKQVKPGRVTLNDFNFKTPVPDPNLRLLSRSTAPETQKPDTYEIYDSFGGYGDVSEGNRYARIRMEQAISDRETAHGSTDIVGLRAGGKFTLDRHPIESQNREYLLTRVEFIAREATYGSGSGGGGQFFTSSFTCIPMEVTFRPLRTTPLPRIEGPQTATVCGPKDQEIYVDESARVKVQFHWDRYGKADASSSCWIRVSQPWAGAGFGGMAIPRIGHEVIVEFIEGDPDRPIITGRVYNEAHKSPYALPEHATKTTIKSNSSPGSQGFNELRFEDKKGKEQVFIHSQKNFDLRVKNQVRETNLGERHEKIGQSLYVTVSKEENTLIEDKHYEMTMENHLTVKGDLLEKVESNLKTYAGEANVINAKDLLVETSTSVSLKTNLCKIQGAMGVHVRGQQINVEGTSLCLKSGPSYISITPAGIFIQAPMVMINSGGSATPAQEPSPAPEITVMEPLDAYPAAVANPGKTVKVGGGTTKVRTRGGGPVSLHNAPNYTPPPNYPPPPPPQEPTSEKNPGPCVDRVKFQDKEGRFASASNVLEVVVAPLGGSDRITFKPEGSKECGCPGPSYKLGDRPKVNVSSPANVTYGEIDEGGTMFQQISRFFHLSPKAEPLVFTCDKDNATVGSGEVRIYPGDAQKFNFDTTKLLKEHPRIKNLLEGICDMLSKVTGKNVDPINGFTMFQGPIYVAIKPPGIAFEFEGQWTEYKPAHARHWEAYYKFLLKLEGTFIDVALKVDLIYCIGYIPQMAPFKPIFDEVWEYIRPQLTGGDENGPPFYVGLKGALKGAVQIARDPDWQPAGIIELKGSLVIGIFIKLGVVEGEMEASTGVTADMKVQGEGDTAYLYYNFLKWDGIKGKVSVKLDTGWFGTWGHEREVEIMEGTKTGWPLNDKIDLLS